MKLGSLFDGIGTFPLSGLQHGIIPVWASEIEAFPIKVTKHHFPDMKHLGDVTKIDGAEIEPVDIITFGSPCQDLSVAGKREGLAGERSGLFMDAIRIIRQMRTATGGEYPRFAVWENVPGAFSSNKGEDFRAVLEEITEAEIPMPRSGKWANAGMVRTERIDIAWRCIDAQYWGVPQRRKRIFLVADFGGQCAGEILFIEEGLRGHFAESREAGEEIAGDVGDGVERTIFAIAFGGAREQNVSSPLMANEGPNRHQGYSNTQFDAVCIRMRERCAGGGEGPSGHCNHVLSSYWDGGQISDCLDCSMLAKGQMMPEKRRFPAVLEPQLYDMTHACVCLQGSMIGRADKNGPQDDGVNEEVSFTLNTTDRHAVATRYAVRRLTPLECERLQGLPDNWTNIEGASDTARYKAIGNGIAKPCSDFVIGRIAEVLRRAA